MCTTAKVSGTATTTPWIVTRRRKENSLTISRLVPQPDLTTGTTTRDLPTSASTLHRGLVPLITARVVVGLRYGISIIPQTPVVSRTRDEIDLTDRFTHTYTTLRLQKIDTKCEAQSWQHFSNKTIHEHVCELNPMALRSSIPSRLCLNSCVGCPFTGMEIITSL